MSDFLNNAYLIEKNFNDFGPRSTNVGLVGKTEVTILDNLYRISQLLHGRILTSTSIAGGYKVYIERSQIREIILAYQAILPYKLSQELASLINALRSLFHAASADTEVGLDSRIILQMTAVHNTISINLKRVWQGVIGLRLISQSGFNKDVTFDGKQQILDSMLSKFTESEMSAVRDEMEVGGQLGGIKAPRQIDMRDMIADLLFSRKDSYVTLHQMFHTMTKQRADLRQFRTDILFCPVERYKELDAGLNVQALIDSKVLDTDETKTTITPLGFTYAEFKVKNNSLVDKTFDIAGGIGSGSVTLKPYQEIELGGTGLTITTTLLSGLSIELWVDIREYIGTGSSIITLATEGKLNGNSMMSHLYYQIIKPIIPYMTSLVKKIKSAEFLQLCISKLPTWAQTIFENLQPGYVYSGLLLTDPESTRERTLYIYILTMMLPEFLLDPTFTFSDISGTPPYVHEYGLFVQGLKKLYD